VTSGAAPVKRTAGRPPEALISTCGRVLAPSQAAASPEGVESQLSTYQGGLAGGGTCPSGPA
jgi:hypothetical protein